MKNDGLVFNFKFYKNTKELYIYINEIKGILEVAKLN